MSTRTWVFFISLLGYPQCWPHLRLVTGDISRTYMMYGPNNVQKNGCLFLWLSFFIKGKENFTEALLPSVYCVTFPFVKQPTTGIGFTMGGINTIDLN